MPASATAAATEQASGGLPQFDLAQWPGQMIWTLIIFLVLFTVLSRVFVPRIGDTIAKREDKIGGDIRDARRLKDEAEAQAAAAADELSQARARAQKLALDAKAAAQGESAARQAEEEAKVAEVLAAAEARIAAARTEAMTHVRSIAGETASAIVEKLTGAGASTAEVERALASLA